MPILEHILRLLTPYDCLGCDTEGSLICAQCSRDLLETLPSRCYRCFVQYNGNKTCDACRRHTVLRHVWVRTSYTPLARKTVHTLKYSYARDAAKVIAKEIYRALPALPENTVIIHIPTITSHVRQRGFDQAALIARELSKLTSLPHVHGLARSGQARQVGSTKQVRSTQMQSVFRPLSTSIYKNLPVLLVDDVTTTGATLEAAALCLRRAGAASVSAAVFAGGK